MVRAPSQLTHMPKFIIVILSLLTIIAPACLSSGNPTNPHLLLPPAHPHAPPAYILPLHRSTSNSSTSNPHRLLQRSESSRRPNAHMRLYDDLLLNGYGYFPLLFPIFLIFFISVFVFGIWIEIVEVDLALKVLHDAALDWDAASEICAYCGYREHCYVRSLLHLRAMWHTPGCYLYFITLNIYFKGYILINLLVRSYLI